MNFTTQILEILIVILVSIELVELYFNMRAIRIHEKELNGHLTKLEQHTMKMDILMNHLDEHIKTLGNALRKNEPKET